MYVLVWYKAAILVNVQLGKFEGLEDKTALTQEIMESMTSLNSRGNLIPVANLVLQSEKRRPHTLPIFTMPSRQNR